MTWVLDGEARTVRLSAHHCGMQFQAHWLQRKGIIIFSMYKPPEPHYEEHDCKVHPAINTVTKVCSFGSWFPAKSSYHDDCHKNEKYGGQTIGTVHDLLEWRNKISHCDWSDTTPFVCFAEKGNLKIDTFATVLMARPSMGESRSW